MGLPSNEGSGSGAPRIPDNEHKGTYRDPVEGLSDDQRWPLKQLPQAPAPAPFRIGG